MKAVCLTGRETVEIRKVDDVRAGPGEVALAPEYVGLCGTDLHVFLGQLEYRVPYPAVLGHECGARVAELGGGVDGLAVGDRVVIDPVFPCGACPLCKAGRFNICRDIDVLGIDCAGALAERVVVDAANVFPLPESVEPKHAAMAELYSVAVHASRITKVETGDVVVVLGAGRLGLSLIDVLRGSGAAKLVAVDLLDSRLEVAKAIGADLAWNAREVDPVERARELTGGLGVDKVVEAVGHARAVEGQRPPMHQAVQMIRPGGQVTAMGQGDADQPVFWRDFVLKEASIVSSRLNLGDLPRALDLMARGLVHPDAIITHTLLPKQVDDGFHMMHDRPDEAIKVVVDMSALGA